MGKRPGTVNIQEIATAAAVEALKLQKNEERMRIRKNRFGNTELLLKNYLNLIEHFELSQDKASEEDMEAYNFEEADMEDVIIRSIRRSRIRTLIMVLQIEICLEKLRTKMIDKGQLEKYVVLEKLYLDPTKSLLPWLERVRIIAAEIPCSESSVNRWKNDMIRELSVLIFGADGLQLEL
ncbi:hypothetical protein E4K67_17390 [Desulfosporosinus fructosivorans]|uniref:Uncharacterized protein n=1 Tax=Desulfosporosinus fructosivorans TaxID=2018669 RepID=A0A4Z0R3Y3_9FIRM|nr:hypothetical protein [Desulfosporosinus fructosivorans]TGE36873.1 hypothetical protein E4K67_17390 [Desulfosporosinus fructosivorans]